jgi:uracil-DNA glycosylase
MPSTPDAPYALASEDEQKRRNALLSEPHMKPLTEYLEQVRSEMGTGYEMPMFDPCDGGINARVLFLLEAPGPKAVGSAFISRNNPDPTARNMCELLEKAGIPRQDTLLWNIVPWYIGDKDSESGKSRIRPANNKDITVAMPHLETLLKLLPSLEIIVLVGKKAQSTSKDIKRHQKITNTSLIETHHPSARVFNVWKHKRAEAEADFAQIAKMLGYL